MLASIKTLHDHTIARLHSLAWIGPLLVRLTVGLVFATTGWGKLQNLDNVVQFFESLGIPAPGFHAAFVSGLELVGGLLVLAGLGTRIFSALLIGVMAVALWTARWSELHGVVDLANTIELTYLVMFAWLVVSGAGAVSLDHLLTRRGSDARIAEAP